MDFSSNSIRLSERGQVFADEGTQQEVNRGYESACRYVLNFLNAYLKKDAAALRLGG